MKYCGTYSYPTARLNQGLQCLSTALMSALSALPALCIAPLLRTRNEDLLVGPAISPDWRQYFVIISSNNPGHVAEIPLTTVLTWFTFPFSTYLI